MSRFKAVIFDLDGTLIDSMWMWKTIDIEYLGRYGIDIPGDLAQSIEGKSFSETAEYFKERFCIPDSVDGIKSSWNDMAHDIYTHRVALKQGAFSFIDRLKRNGVKLGIATSNSRELTECVLKARNIIDYFGAIVTGCDVGKGKPNPDVYLKAADILCVQPSDCLVFEDIPQGIMAGINAGMTTCAVDDEYSALLEQEKKRLADYYIYDYNEAEKIV